MFAKIAIGVAVVLIVLIIIVATRPSAFRIERSITLAAPPEAAFAQVDDFHAWRAWSPWEKMDPDLKRTYGGPPAGVGSTYAWAGNSKVGEGRMTIEKSEPGSRIEIELVFIKPWQATNRATFTFAPTADGTRVTWAMDGRNNFMAKAAHLVMDIDKLVGKDFERGLSAMKTVAETKSTAASAQAAVLN